MVNQYGRIAAIWNANPANPDSVIVPGAGSIWDGSDEFEIALFIQVKGTGVYDPSNTPPSLLWGTEYSAFNSGIYSFMLVDRVEADSIVIFSSFLREDMVEPPDSVPPAAQLVKVPYGKSFRLTGDIRSTAWDPVSGTGGVLALFASDKLDLAGHNIDVSARGFLGGDTMRYDPGIVLCASPARDSTFYLDTAEHLAGRKGESTVFSGYRYTRGNGFIAGGGGGGEGRYSGGAGGSNFGKGARGGREASDLCFPVRNYGGWGGTLSSTYYGNSQNRIFMGSGGGSSVPEPGLRATPGGNGGGIVIIITDTLAGDAAGDTIFAYGGSVTDTSFTGGGGGGAGGFIVLDVNNVEGKVHLDVSGGDGGDTYDPVVTNIHGPGGGGGGGVIWHSGSTLLGGLTENKSAGNAGEHLPVGDLNEAGSGFGATTFQDLVLPLRGFFFNFISGDQDVCQDSIPATIIGSQPKGDTGFVYAWQDSTAGMPWQTIPGAVSKDYSPDTLTVTTWFRRIVTKKTPPIESDTSGFVVKVVYNRLRNNRIANNDTICYNLVPVPMFHTGPPITGGDGVERLYHWQARQAGSPGWSDAAPLALDGVSTDSVYKPGNLLETTWFRRQVISHVCTHISDSLTVTVLPDITGNQITGNDRVCQFTEPADSIRGPVPGGGNTLYEYVWEASSDLAGWDSIDVTRNYFPGSMDTVTTHYRRRVYSGKDRTCKSISDTVTIRVDPIVQQNRIAPDTAICAETATNDIYPDAAIFGGDGSYLYTFEKSTDSVNWSVAREAGAQPGYNPGELPETTWFRRIAESGACRDTTAVIKFYVDTVILNNLIYPDDTICAGTASGTINGTVATGGDWSGYTYLWDRSTDRQNWTTGFETGLNLPPRVLYDSTWFRRRVLSGVCVDTSEMVVVNVHDAIIENEIWVESEACIDLPHALRGTNEADGLYGGTGNPADFRYLWEFYDPDYGQWVEAPSGGPLSNNQHGYITDTLTAVLYSFRRYVESGKCSDTSDSLAVNVNPRPVGLIADTFLTEECYSDDDILISVPVTLSVGPPLYTLYYSDGQGGSGQQVFAGNTGAIEVYRTTADSTMYTIRIDSLIDANGCRALVSPDDPVKPVIIYRNQPPSLVQDTFRVCGDEANIEIVPGLGSLKYWWGPDSLDYTISPENNHQAVFKLKSWKNDTLFYPVTWSQRNGWTRDTVCPLNQLTITVELYQEPQPARVQPADTTVYFRQILPLWADTVAVGLGTWMDWDWETRSGDPVTEIHNNKAPADLGSDDLNSTVERYLTWMVENGECPDTEIRVRIERKDLVLYSAFSPNGDAFNEFLILDGLEFAEQFTMRIFSRYGILIKTVTEADLIVDPLTGEDNAVWDGRMEDGSEAEDGTYFYMIEVMHAGQTYHYKNYLELIRSEPAQ